MTPPVCPDCNIDMHLKNSKYGTFWSCPNYPACDMKIGAHQESGNPLGIPASKEGRAWRVKAHDEFDKLWNEGNVTRGQAYRWLTKVMKLGEPAHIGNMSIPECRRVIGICKLTPPKELGKHKE